MVKRKTNISKLNRIGKFFSKIRQLSNLESSKFFAVALSILERLSNSFFLRSVSNGFMTLLPYLLTTTSFVLIYNLINIIFPNVSPWQEFKGEFLALHRLLNGLLPLLAVSAISLSMAQLKRIERLPAIAIAFLSFFILAKFDFKTADIFFQNLSQYMFLLFPSTLSVLVMERLFRQEKLQLVHSKYISGLIRDNFNLFLPFFLTLLLVYLFRETVDWLLLKNIRLEGLMLNINSLWGVIFHTASVQTLWFLGIHGDNAMFYLESQFTDNTLANQAAVLSGFAPLHIVTREFINVFVKLGGCGSVWCLAIAILLFSKNPSKRAIAMAGLPLITFNISEIYVFCLPIVLNPIFLFPFIFVPVIQVIITYTAMLTGFVPYTSQEISWLTPLLIGAYLVTGKSIAGIILQIINLSVGTLIYAFFLRISERNNLQTSESDGFVKERIWLSRHLDASHPELVNLQKKLELRETLTELDRGQFVLYYQPQIELNTNKVSGVEALIRLKREKKIIGPYFLKTLEETNLILDLDIWVFREACRQAHKWFKEGYFLEIGINVTPSSLMNQDFVQEIQYQAKKCPLPINIELTETTLMKNIKSLIHILNECNSSVRISLDDFGTGYSSLAYLHQLPVHVIKIDKTFADDIAITRSQKVLKSILHICQQLNCQSLIEGIETKEQFDFIKEIGIDSAQGYFIAKPMPAEEIVNFIKNW